MKILHVIDMISQQKAGGSAKVPFQLGQAQAELGHEVTIFASDYEAREQKAPDGVELRKFNCVANAFGVKVTPGMMFANVSQFDIIHLHNYRTLVNIMIANKGVPYILQAHGSCLPIRTLTNHLHNFVWRTFVLNKAQAYIADAEMEIEQYGAEGADRAKVSVLPVGIDFREFAVAPPRQQHNKKRVLFLGRFHHIKGPDILVRAFSLLEREDATLVITGVDYGMEAEVRKLVKTLNLEDKVEYLPACFGADKVREYTNADVYVMPSRYEMFGLTLLEALACGTPVIITDCCGVAKYLPTECGIVAPCEPGFLAQAINKALDSNMADSYRQYRINWARQYDWGNIAPKVISVYEGI